MALLNLGRFADFLEQRADAGDGYIMCAVGQNPKMLSEWYFSGQYEGVQLKKAYEWRENAERVWDCQGLADGYVSEMTGVKINVRARNNYAEWCGIKGEGIIPSERRVRGAAVFRRGNYVEHVGFLVRPVNADDPAGDWIVVEAMGVMAGVVHTRLSERNWNLWGWMTKYFDYPQAADRLPGAYGERTLRRGMAGGDVAALQADLIVLNYSCGKWGADGEFGAATESALKAFQRDHGLKEDGIAGVKTYGMLDELLVERGDMPEEEQQEAVVAIAAGQSWNVRAQPDVRGSVMGYARRGERYPVSGYEAAGWIGILYNGEEAWVSAKAAG